jgi:hypothetical protein
MAAQPTVLASVGANTPVSARDGWVAWSTPTGGGWMLAAWHRGASFVLPVASRPQPFDANVGTDAAGRAVATFSRCIVTPYLSFFNDGPFTSVLGRGCRLREVDLVTGRERGVAVPHPAGSSDTNPSMLGSRIAFARLDPARHGQVEQVLLWTPRTHRLSVLRHGGMPTTCPFSSCTGMARTGTVQGLDLGSRLVTFLWMIQAPGVFGHGGWEVRADRLDNRRSVLVGSGELGEACTGPGDDLDVPSPPVATGRQAWYSELSASCYVFTNTLVRYDAIAPAAATAHLPPETLQLARDGQALYALVAPAPQTETDPTCKKPGAPCQIERLTTPALTPNHVRPRPPY